MLRNSLLSRITIALVLAIGVSVAWGFIVLWGAMIAEAIFPNRGEFQRIVFSSDGTPVIETATYYGTGPSTYVSLDGKEYDDPDVDWRNTMYQSATLTPFAAQRSSPCSRRRRHLRLSQHDATRHSLVLHPLQDG